MIGGSLQVSVVIFKTMKYRVYKLPNLSAYISDSYVVDENALESLLQTAEIICQRHILQFSNRPRKYKAMLNCSNLYEVNYAMRNDFDLIHFNPQCVPLRKYFEETSSMYDKLQVSLTLTISAMTAGLLMPKRLWASLSIWSTALVVGIISIVTTTGFRRIFRRDLDFKRIQHTQETYLIHQRRWGIKAILWPFS